MLSYLKQNNKFYKDVILRSDLEENILQVNFEDTGVGRQLDDINGEHLGLLNFVINIDVSIPIILEDMKEVEEDNAQDFYSSILKMIMPLHFWILFSSKREKVQFSVNG